MQQQMSSINDILCPDVLEKILSALQSSGTPVDAAGARCVCKQWSETILRSRFPADGMDSWLVLLFTRPNSKFNGDGPVLQPVAQMEGVPHLATGQGQESELTYAKQWINSLDAVECDPRAVVDSYEYRLPVTKTYLQDEGANDKSQYMVVDEGPEDLTLDCWMVDPNSSRWFQVALPPLRASMSYLIRSSAFGGSGRSGLLAIFKNSRLHPSYWIGNPMTNTWRNIMSPQLGQPSSSSGWWEWMTSELIVYQKYSYKIVQLRVTCSQQTWYETWDTWPQLVIRAVIFESTSNSWLTTSMPSTGQLRGALASTCGFSGNIYILLIDQLEYEIAEGYYVAVGPLRATVLTYDGEDNEFKTVVPASDVTYSEGAPGSSIVWQSMKLIVKKDPSTGTCCNSPGDALLEIWAGITTEQDYDELDFIQSWRLVSFCVLRFSQNTQSWRVQSTSDMVPEEDCQTTPAGGTGESECMAFDANPMNGTELYFTALDPVCTMLGKFTDGARLYSPLKFPSPLRCHIEPSTSSATINPQFDISP